MKRVLKELFKTCILSIVILISLRILDYVYEPVHVKANRVLGQGKYIGHEFTKEEMDKVLYFQKNYSNVQNKFGQLKMAQIRLDEQEVSLEENLKNLQNEEQKFLDGITDKYGEGTLNPENSVFTPNKSN